MFLSGLAALSRKTGILLDACGIQRRGYALCNIIADWEDVYTLVDFPVIRRLRNSSCSSVVGCPMRVRFRKAKHTIEEKAPAKHLDSLRQACKECGRQDLYEPLSRVLKPNIGWLNRDLELLLKTRSYILAANVMLYESKAELARKYLEEAIRLAKVGSARHLRLITVLGNLDTVAKIARRSWQIEGECAPTQKKRQVGWSAVPPTRSPTKRGMRRLERREMAVRVRDLMTRSLVSMDPEDTVTEAARLMDRKRIHSILIGSHGNEFSGIITDLDIVSRVVSKGLDPSKVKVREVMTSPLVSIGEDATIEECAKKMRENGVRRLIVESDDGKVGMIAESDIVRVTPELHFLIRERSQLEAGLTSTAPKKVVLSGYCEMCGNYSSQLRNVDSKWLCEDCRGR